MFDLETSIADWKRKMRAAGVSMPEPLEELENHLRDEINSLMSTGKLQVDAFAIAVLRVGEPDAIAAEFKKTRWFTPLRIGLILWLLPVLVTTLLFGCRWFGGTIGLVLAAHIVAITAGYSAAFFIGGFAFLYVLGSMFTGLSVCTRRELSQAVFTFSGLAAGLDIAGLVLAMVWSQQNLGRLWSNDPKEIGGLCAAGWFTLLWAVQLSGKINDRMTMLLSIVGSAIVSLGWFGANLLVHGRQMESSWLLDGVVGAHLSCLLMGLIFVRGKSATGVATSVVDEK